MNPQNQKSLNLDLILPRNHRMNRCDFLENKNHENSKLRLKLNQIRILKQN